MKLIPQMDPQDNGKPTSEPEKPSKFEAHPNGRPIKSNHPAMKRPKRNDELILENIFPENYIGKLLKGLLTEFLTKQEHRLGWARKSACDDDTLMAHPNETVAAHQWGVATLVMAIAREPKFQEELPNFDRLRAIEMALIHDVAELTVGDITPVDGISEEEKHRREKEAMGKILACFSETVGQSLHQVYKAYEDRVCNESKFVKDCDKLDFIIYAFLLERQGFTGFSEFYTNSKKYGFATKIAADLAEVLIETRNELTEKNLLFRRNL